MMDKTETKDLMDRKLTGKTENKEGTEDTSMTDTGKTKNLFNTNGWRWSGKPKTLRLFTWLLEHAETEDRPFEAVVLYRGDVFTSMQEIGIGTGLSPREIRTAMDHMLKTGDVTTYRYGYNRVIQIPCYDDFVSVEAGSCGKKFGQDSADEIRADENQSEEIRADKNQSEENRSNGIRNDEARAECRAEDSNKSDKTSDRDATIDRNEQGFVHDANPVICPDHRGGYRGVESMLPGSEKECKKENVYTHNHKKNSRAASEDSLPEGFEEFWAVYPRHTARGRAERAWRNLKPDVATRILILEALSLWKDSEAWKVDNGRYIPYPANWLNDRRWEDDPAEITRQAAPKAQGGNWHSDVPAARYEQRDYSEVMETPEEMLERLQRGVGTRV